MPFEFGVLPRNGLLKMLGNGVHLPSCALCHTGGAVPFDAGRRVQPHGQGHARAGPLGRPGGQ
eukprot:6240999-Alexandrium_andersonii.AAC.1